MGGGLGDIVGTRVRFQRLSDARNFNGWILRLKGDGLVVNANSGAEVDEGDEYRFEAFGSERSLEFRAVLVKAGSLVAEGMAGSLQRYMALRLVGRPTESPKKENVRLHIDGMSAWVRIGRTKELVEVVDIAPQGVGIRCRTVFEPGSEVDLDIDTVYGIVHNRGKVCYCRRPREARGLGRVGIALYEFNRVDGAKWDALFHVPRMT